MVAVRATGYATAMNLPTPELKFFADVAVRVAAAHEVGAGVHGQRRVIPILSGEATGDGWRARILPGGADFQLIVNDQLAELDARYVLELDGGDLVYVQNTAVRSGPPELMAKLVRGEPVPTEAIYFRCFPRFETASPALAWISRRLFVGTGARHPDSVHMRFFELG
jgi:hypothetical protein